MTLFLQLLALAEQLKELDGLLCAKTAQNSDLGPQDPHPEPKPPQDDVAAEQGGWARDGEVSDDSLNSCSLPSRYLPKKSVNTSTDTAQNSTSHSPFSDMAGLDSLSNSPEQLAGSPSVGEEEREGASEKRKERRTMEAEKARWQQSTGHSEVSGGRGRGRGDQAMETQASGTSAHPVSEDNSTVHSGEPPPTPLPGARGEGSSNRGKGTKNTTPFLSRIPLRIRSSFSSTHDLPLYRTSPRRTPNSGHTPIKRNMGTIQLRKHSSPAILEGKRPMRDVHGREYPEGGLQAERPQQPLSPSTQDPFFASPVNTSHRMAAYRAPQYDGRGNAVGTTYSPLPLPATPPISSSYAASQEFDFSSATTLTPTSREQLGMRGEELRGDGSKLTA